MWKSVEASFVYGGRNLRFDIHVYYRKALHFMSDCSPYFGKGSPYFRPYIMAYTIENESSRMIRVPKEARSDMTCKMKIYKWGKPTSSNESICLVRLRKNVFTIWVLSDYEIGKWRRVLKIRVKAMGVKEEDHVHVTTFTVMNGDRLIFATEMKIYGYDTLHPCGHTAVTLPLIQQH
ncbi:hypothetical protein K1719_034239 [Acacia pycnantha]|nr:hypothetical protein K1719_034239 [Acacia pycnantha]